MIWALWLAMLVSALGNAGGAGDAAIRFLEKARARQLDLKPGGDTALSPETTTAKRRQIAGRLRRLAADLGKEPLEVGAVKVDQDIAGVLVFRNSGFDPAYQQVFPVALVRRGESWLAAPVPASFENTGIGYSGDHRKRAAALQEWMLNQQVLELAKLRDQATERLHQAIAKSVPVDSLRSLDSREVVKRFLDACGRRALPEMLGLLGGLDEHPPADWALRLKYATSAARDAEVKQPWRLLVSGNVLRVPLRHEVDDGQALVTVGFLDPAGESATASAAGLEFLHLELVRQPGGLWQVDLPQEFFQEPAKTTGEQVGLMEPGLLEDFAKELAKLHPPTPAPDARQAADMLLERLQHAELADVIRTMRPAENSSGPYVAAARAWWAFREPGFIRRMIPLAFKEEPGCAALICQVFSSRSPDTADLRSFHFEKTDGGWLWSPEPGAETKDVLDPWTQEETEHWKHDWQDRLLADCVELEHLPESGAPSEADARAVVESWLKAIAAGDPVGALRFTARLAKPESKTTVLHNLGYELAGRRLNEEPPAIASVSRGNVWTAVGVRGVAEDKPSHPLYPVVNTPAGPRIFIEIDLFASDSRTRDFLNRTALDRLRDLPEATAELRELFQKYQAAIAQAAEP